MPEGVSNCEGTSLKKKRKIKESKVVSTCWCLSSANVTWSAQGISACHQLVTSSASHLPQLSYLSLSSHVTPTRSTPTPLTHLVTWSPGHHPVHPHTALHSQHWGICQLRPASTSAIMHFHPGLDICVTANTFILYLWYLSRGGGK